MGVEDFEAGACDDADRRRDRQGIIMVRRIRHAAVRRTMTAGEAVRSARRGRIVPMRDVRDRVQRERQQQADESDS